LISAKYRSQVDLLLQVLPYVSNEEIFALRGGTAINLFIREMPRLSVDLDLTYLPVDSRPVALANIHEGLSRIKQSIENAIRGLKVISVPHDDGPDIKLNCQYPGAQIKIEVNTTMRGHLFPVNFMQVNNIVQKEFGKFAAINVVANAELFGSKIAAALDRQHPRDLFDIRLLLNNEGITDNIHYGFIVALLSHYKPIHELLRPVLKNQKSAFDSQFAGMAAIEFTYDDYIFTRSELIEMLGNLLTENDKKLVLSFVDGYPDWRYFPFDKIKELPAVQWKLQNITKLRNENSHKHLAIMKATEEILYGK
jgi:predicted nucleotidyltransferase component of viral defense system